MEELFLPYHLSVLAKENGFNEPCLACYNSKDEKIMLMDIKPFVYNKDFTIDFVTVYDHIITAPLYQQIIDWFRINHGIEICIIPDSESQSNLSTRIYNYTIFLPFNGCNLQPKIGRGNGNIVSFINPKNALIEAISKAFEYSKDLEPFTTKYANT